MEDKQDFTSGSIFQKIVGFMLPVLGALILQAMYSAVDMLIVGRFGTTAGISGVSTGSEIILTVTFIVSALSIGVTVLIGQYIGEKRPQDIGELVGSSVVFFAIVSAAVTAFLIVFAGSLADILKAPPEARDLTIQYIRICGGGYIFIVFYNFIASIFRGMGNSRLPLLFVGIACVVNILGDLLLVAVFKMNVVGAAIATVAAQAVSVLLSLLIIRKQKLPFQLKKTDFRLTKKVGDFVRIGIPMAFSEALTNLTFLALTSFINALGLAASSGYGVANRVVAFAMLLPSALMQSMAPFVAQNVGARKEDRARKGLLCGIAIGCGIGVFVALAVFLKGDWISSVFTKDPAVIARSFEFLQGFAPEAIITCVLFSFMGYFNGHAKTKFVLLQGVAQSFLVRLPMSYIMSRQPNASLTYIGLAAPAATVFGILLCVIYYIRTKTEFDRNTPENGI